MNITLDGETSDRITALTLAEHRNLMLEQLEREDLHDEDRGKYSRLVKAIDILITEYFEVPA
jgi:hypothetical protein